MRLLVSILVHTKSSSQFKSILAEVFAGMPHADMYDGQQYRLPFLFLYLNRDVLLLLPVPYLLIFQPRESNSFGIFPPKLNCEDLPSGCCSR